MAIGTGRKRAGASIDPGPLTRPEMSDVHVRAVTANSGVRDNQVVQYKFAVNVKPAAALSHDHGVGR